MQFLDIQSAAYITRFLIIVDIVQSEVWSEMKKEKKDAANPFLR